MGGEMNKDEWDAFAPGQQWGEWLAMRQERDNAVQRADRQQGLANLRIAERDRSDEKVVRLQDAIQGWVEAENLYKRNGPAAAGRYWDARDRLRRLGEGR